MASDRKVIYSSGLFGEYSPYYTIINGRAKVYDSLRQLIQDNPSKGFEFDPVSVLSLINFNHITGDRTLVKGVSRVPWHSDLHEDGTVTRHPPISHGSVKMDEDAVAEKIIEYMGAQLSNILSKHRTVWLGLSGGYDSRVVAGVLRKVATEDNEIKVLNWGAENTRDTVYARRIAEHYQWEYVYIPISPSTIKSMMTYTVRQGGAEFSPFDYNPLEITPAISDRITKEDAVLFAHYGDTIGRGEAQGKHITKQNPKAIGNPYLLFNARCYGRFCRDLDYGRSQAWAMDQSDNAEKLVARNELCHEENFLRRVLTKKFPFCEKYDPFANVELVKFIYSLSADCRNDRIYERTLKKLDSFLYDLPWARTGSSFGGNKESDGSVKENYSPMKKDILAYKDEVGSRLLNGQLVKANIINRGALEQILSVWCSDTDLSQMISRLNGIELLISEYELFVEPLPESRFANAISGWWAYSYGVAKRARKRIKDNL